MWVFTPKGFYSVVQKREDRADDMVQVRTRNRADINALKMYFPDAKPYRVKRSDYSWRIRVPREDWATAVARMALKVDYSNFKDEVTRLQGWERHDVYLRVWSVLLSLRDQPKRRRQRTHPANRSAERRWDGDTVFPPEPMLTDRDFDDLLGGRL